MNDMQTWLMIPQLVDRYGASGARAIVDLLSGPGQDPVSGFIVRADAHLVEKQHKEAAQLYAQAARASDSLAQLHKSIGLYEAAVMCDPDTILIRTELMAALSRAGWFWRVSDHLHECMLRVHPERTIDQWLAPLHTLSLDVQIQKNLLQYLTSIGNLFTLKTDQAKIAEVLALMEERSTDIDRVTWKKLVGAESSGKEDVTSTV